MTGTPYQPRNAMHWQPADPAIEAARRVPGWREFHFVCGKQRVYFDNIESLGKRKGYRAVAFTIDDDLDRFLLAEGKGKGPIEAVLDAYQKADRPVPEAREWIARMTGNPPPEEIDEDLLGGEAEKAEDEDLIG